MARHYLEFEKPIQDFEDKIMKLQSLENDEVNPLELKKLIDRRDKKIEAQVLNFVALEKLGKA